MGSPRERGCSAGQGPGGVGRAGVPARAGVFRLVLTSKNAPPGGPRASGGVPPSPPTGARPAWGSPRERGCSALTSCGSVTRKGVPARAGVFRRSEVRRCFTSWGPRASGGVPDGEEAFDLITAGSPRERGCSGGRPSAARPRPGVPARAGVFRLLPTRGAARLGGPRASGGVPLAPVKAAASAAGSPRERGCSGAGNPLPAPLSGVPARAGVFRLGGGADRSGWRGPRASGGVPVDDLTSRRARRGSPRERGCSGA